MISIEYSLPNIGDIYPIPSQRIGYAEDYFLKFEAPDTKVSLLNSSHEEIFCAYWGGGKFLNENLKFLTVSDFNYDKRIYCGFEGKGVKVEVSVIHGGGVGLFGRNQLWYVRINGVRVAALRIKSIKGKKLIGFEVIYSKFLYKDNKLDLDCFDGKESLVAWAILHFACNAWME
ncbi:hypothetical protein TDB9533_01334 [Thalassocella blandensis]|nr:hypothetical protein TDB9533_01334 [Thalassocella blandensis]